MNDPYELRRLVFTYRSYTPIPFLLLMVVFARPTAASMAGGFLFVLLGEAVRFWGVSIAGSETRTTGTVGGTYLITNGPFAYVRNPLYVGNMLIYAGIGLMSLALFPWLFLAACGWFALQYALIVNREEEYLAARFGEEYAAYRNKVPRFLPRLTPYRSANPPAKSATFEEGLASERRTLQAVGLVVLILLVMYLIRGGGQ
jgi:protein-S-isoprenylcysteine O-methyltransferase Ste14